jgi:hypothetical protein
MILWKPGIISRDITIRGYGREICYFLSNNKNHSVDVMIRANNALK